MLKKDSSNKDRNQKDTGRKNREQKKSIKMMITVGR